ncbi:DnaJ domain-containing protein [Thamnocephalis sphaerospora]|uniref:DnaJ domain-containing protein n=1 Tax=Thamnocephalis sphaerospora TaxID=78915 RepID=A0A4V1IW09_9FUNG|nr:DnaJ domain-containing protein [Thamnocephalis sphaerospora]|eukprot:RKP05919.1 DnaJ domain-containing protein [Thamnocephalis sphaerospora]
MTELPDYYSILGVPRTASAEDIRRAYQREALRCHPDRNNQSRDSTEQFQRLADAYFVLGDTRRRQEYDTATRTHRPFTAHSAHANAEHVFSDAFEELLRPEVAQPGWFWWLVGCIGGFLIGFIIANIFGAIMGVYIGGKLGSIRDNKGECPLQAARCRIC